MKELESKNKVESAEELSDIKAEIRKLEIFKNEIETEMAELYTDLMTECPNEFSAEQAPVVPKKATA